MFHFQVLGTALQISFEQVETSTLTPTDCKIVHSLPRTDWFMTTLKVIESLSMFQWKTSITQLCLTILHLRTSTKLGYQHFQSGILHLCPKKLDSFYQCVSFWLCCIVLAHSLTPRSRLLWFSSLKAVQFNVWFKVRNNEMISFYSGLKPCSSQIQVQGQGSQKKILSRFMFYFYVSQNFYLPQEIKFTLFFWRQAFFHFHVKYYSEYLLKGFDCIYTCRYCR